MNGTATDAAGAGAVAIPFKHSRVADTTSSDLPGDLADATATGFATTAGSNQLYILEIDSRQCPEDKPFVAVKSVELVDSPLDAAILGILHGARYAGDDMLTGIA